MIPVDLIIYDLDGTLIDSVGDITDAVNAMLKELNLPTRSEAEIKGFIGDGIQDLVARSLGVENQLLKNKALKIAKRCYEVRLLGKTQLYPGVSETLQHFQSKIQTVLTNKPQQFTDVILKGLKVDSYFRKVIGADSGFPKKPKPDAIQHLLTTYRVEPARVVIVGDSHIDIETGRQAGILTCAVTNGLGHRAELEQAKPSHIIGWVRDIQTLFK